MRKKNLLIVKTSAFGDVVQTFYVIQDIARARPDLRIFWCVDQRFADLAALHPAVFGVLSIPIRNWKRYWYLPKTILEIIRWREKLRSLNLDISIDLQGMYKSAFISWLSGAKRRIGRTRFSSAEGVSQYLNNKRYDLPRVPGLAGRIRSFVAIALGYDLEALKLSSGFGLWQGGTGIVLAIGASRQEKKWPLKNWAEFILLLVESNPSEAITVLWGNAIEQREALDLSKISPKVQVLSSLKSPRALADIFRSSTLVVGADTGPTHLAASLGVPVIMIFGVTSPKNYSHEQLPNLKAVGGAGWPLPRAVLNCMSEG